MLIDSLSFMSLNFVSLDANKAISFKVNFPCSP